MDKVAEVAIKSLMQVQAKYFIEDFALQVMNHLQASVPIDTETLQGFIGEQISQSLATNQSIGLESINPITRFLAECATYTEEKQLRDPESRSTWDMVKNLPSMHHADISNLVYTSAALYQKTVDETLLSVIGNDARNVTGTITANAASRISSEETGGRIHMFGWGVLSDGLWLNGALLKAYDIASTFRPGDPISQVYATEGFNFARQYTHAPIFSEAEDGAPESNYNLLIAHADNAVLTSVETTPEAADLQNLLFKQGEMAFAMDRWQLGLKDPMQMISAVQELSNLAVVVPHLIDVAKNLEDDTLISNKVTARLHQVSDAVTLCLTAFEALRETKYSDTVILSVAAPSADPTVDVFVNRDNYNSYLSQGGNEEDLTQIGIYLDPRKGIPAPVAGWTQSWIENRRDDVVAEVMANQAERLEMLRNNDAAVIRDLVQTNLNQITASYADAAGLPDVPHSVKLKINEVSRKVTNAIGTESFSLEEETLKILVQTTADPFLASVTDRFTSFASSQDENVRKNARALTVAATAIEDAFAFMGHTA